MRRLCKNYAREPSVRRREVDEVSGMIEGREEGRKKILEVTRENRVRGLQRKATCTRQPRTSTAAGFTKRPQTAMARDF